MKNQQEINPFHELYVTETAQPEEFVELFSPVLVRHALLLFQRGNVVLKGAQGSGKSMLLGLLKPEICMAYQKSREEYPVPAKLRQFVVAGINLTRSGAVDIGQRPIERSVEEDERLFPLYFADFVNYWVVRDLVRNLDLMMSEPRIFRNVLRSRVRDEFARILAGDPCWFGYLGQVRTYEELKARLDERITVYRAFNQANIDTIPPAVKESKTGIGVPISAAGKALHKSKLTRSGVNVFVVIDQHEILCRSDDLRADLGRFLRQVVNKAISLRDPHVSYRVGTRPYAWRDDIRVFGTTAPLEINRDYRLVDLDEILRRKEDPATWIFPTFARDVFARRIRHARVLQQIDRKALDRVMRRPIAPLELARSYVGKSVAQRALTVDPGWTKEWRNYLDDLFKENPLSAKLAEAWLRQKNGAALGGKGGEPPPRGKLPWERQYWQKERIRQALMQLAARCGQRLMWSGADQLLSLAMGSILVFVSISQHIWDAFLRSERGKEDADRLDPTLVGIPNKVQAVGILTASRYWYEKIPEQPGGDSRQRFIDHLGRLFYQQLVEDKAMSYPGHNGFSLVKDDLRRAPSVASFLNEAVDYGDLLDAPHTTKMADRKQRIKWYLNPILSPYFRIPESHVKEPMYTTVAAVRHWLDQAGVILEAVPSEQSPPPKRSKGKNRGGEQLELPIKGDGPQD